MILTIVIILLRAIVGFISLITTGFNRHRGGEGTGEEGEGDGNGSGGSIDGGSFTAKIDSSDDLNRDLFPPLTMIDMENAEVEKVPMEMEDITLEEFVLRFQSYACNHHKVYYQLPLLRSFIAGMAASRLLILQGFFVHNSFV